MESSRRTNHDTSSPFHTNLEGTNRCYRFPYLHPPEMHSPFFLHLLWLCMFSLFLCLTYRLLKKTDKKLKFSPPENNISKCFFFFFNYFFMERPTDLADYFFKERPTELMSSPFSHFWGTDMKLTWLKPSFGRKKNLSGFIFCWF